VSKPEAGSLELGEMVVQAVSALDVERVQREYREQNECVFLERFLPPEVVRQVLVPEVERLRPAVHRNYIPGHKKGGSGGPVHGASGSGAAVRKLPAGRPDVQG
jgi:hypothetical protein